MSLAPTGTRALSDLLRQDPSGLRILFVKTELGYPRSRGHDIRAFNMMRSLVALGHVVGLVTSKKPSDEAVKGLTLDHAAVASDEGSGTLSVRRFSALQTWLASYVGASAARREAVAAEVERFRPDVVVGVGPDVLPYLASLPAVPCVWYAADEWVSHLWTTFNASKPRTWKNLSWGVFWGTFERAFIPAIDRVWVVTDIEQQAMRRWAGARRVDVLPNGVDAEYFAPQSRPTQECSAIFWGRLDWRPNLQALDWFLGQVWPELHRRHPFARFQIIGFGAGEEARAFAKVPGVSVWADVPDLRAAVGEHEVVVMPFQASGGIKNKVLEAAAMGKAIVCTSMACNGLRAEPPVVLASTAEQWIESVSRLWVQRQERQALEADARAWAVREHSWQRTASDALQTLSGATRRSVEPHATGRTALPAVHAVPAAPLRFLFFKTDVVYPRLRGHDVCAVYMMRALARLGHHVGLVTVERGAVESFDGFSPAYRTALRDLSEDAPEVALPWTQERYAKYFGATSGDMRALDRMANEFNADVVVGVGPDVLPYMMAVSRPRVWYAADEWVSHYWSVLSLAKPTTWGYLPRAVTSGAYERIFVGSVDRVWVVSEFERRAMRRWARAGQVDVLPNGVDSDFYFPGDGPEAELTAVFWGWLDWRPNIQALEWFCHQVWPGVRLRFPGARFTIIGFEAGPDAFALSELPGVTLRPDLPDLRSAVAEHALVVLPFQVGGGIKNKLLEAAAMGKAIVCTPGACQGLRGRPPVAVASTVDEWTAVIARLWTDPDGRHQLGRDAREWVIKEHSWLRTASDAVQSVKHQEHRGSQKHHRRRRA